MRVCSDVRNSALDHTAAVGVDDVRGDRFVVSRRTLVGAGALGAVAAIPGFFQAAQSFASESDEGTSESGTPGEASPEDASASSSVAATVGAGSDSGLDGLIDWVSQEDVYRTVKTFSDDEADKPGDADLESIMKTGTLASSTMGTQPWYFVAVTGYDDQQAIAPDYTTHGTATILCCTTNDVVEGLDTVVEEGMESMSLWKIFDVGDAVGYMCMAALSLGYRVHLETSALHGESDASTGRLSYEEICDKYVKGTYYPAGTAVEDTAPQDAAEHCANIIAALHIGKADLEVDAASGATSVERGTNYAIWSEELAFEEA